MSRILHKNIIYGSKIDHVCLIDNNWLADISKLAFCLIKEINFSKNQKYSKEVCGIILKLLRPITFRDSGKEFILDNSSAVELANKYSRVYWMIPYKSIIESGTFKEYVTKFLELV